LFVLLPVSMLANVVPNSGPLLFGGLFVLASLGVFLVGAGRKEATA